MATREQQDVIDFLISQLRECLDELDRCCNIFETLLEADSQVNIFEMLERFR